MCCDDGLHDTQARLDVPGHVRFVVMCARCGKEQREIGRQTYVPLPRLGANLSTESIAAEARLHGFGAATTQLRLLAPLAVAVSIETVVVIAPDDHRAGPRVERAVSAAARQSLSLALGSRHPLQLLPTLLERVKGDLSRASAFLALCECPPQIEAESHNVGCFVEAARHRLGALQTSAAGAVPGQAPTTPATAPS